MQIFISYAHEDFPVADAIAVGLTGDGHEVFFDSDRLRGGDEYHARIREAIANADLFGFLASPEALESASYALTELGLARDRWPQPGGHLLPVIVRPVDPARMPAYLGAVTYLVAKGNLVAEVLARIAELARRRKRRRLASIAAAAALAAAGGLAVLGEMFPRDRSIDEPANLSVRGSLHDVTTARPVTGATVTLQKDGALLGADRSNADGRFHVSFAVEPGRSALMLKLMVGHGDFVEVSEDVTVVAGRIARSEVSIGLIPTSIKDCRKAGSHAVVVGYFRPPVAAPQAVEFAARIRDALEYELLPELQKGQSTRNDPPIVVVCDSAKPQSDAYYPGFAKALGADAFLGGYVSPSATLSKVVMKISDRFDVFQPPAQAESQPIDLDDPRAARLGPAAHTPILIALATGYEREGQPAECVEVTTAAETILGVLPAALAAARVRCQGALPNRGLLPELQ